MQSKAIFFKSVTLAPASGGVDFLARGLLLGGKPCRTLALGHTFSLLVLSVLSLGGNTTTADSKLRHFEEIWEELCPPPLLSGTPNQYVDHTCTQPPGPGLLRGHNPPPVSQRTSCQERLSHLDSSGQCSL